VDDLEDDDDEEFSDDNETSPNKRMINVNIDIGTMDSFKSIDKKYPSNPPNL